ncbi:hypothetical protein MNBD_GAMMA25-1040 [hydrothermal vent metagenome]|uniref:Uncharacterized protein n=1 Tax=hydrothermal vent metagenome TaxID=652676 RepID=A0A3B1AZM3_9ZZZZ
MLSFIYQIARQFELKHGFSPNLIHLNNEQFDHLCSELADIQGLENLSQVLGMEIVLEADLTHPTVSWSVVDWKQAIAV